MNTAKLAVMLVLVLIVGIFAGSLGTKIYYRHELERSGADRQGPEERVNRIVGRLTADLKLDAGQQAEARKIVAATEARATAVRTSYQPELKRVFDRGFEQIGEKLNAGQKTELQKKQEKLSARFDAMYFKSLVAARSGMPDMGTTARLLGLNASQREKMGAILQDLNKREDLVIEKYQKMERPDLTAADRDMRALRSASMKDLSGVLTRDQLERFKSDIAAW